MRRIAWLAALLAAGCSVTQGSRKPDGEMVVVNYRLLWTTETVDFSTQQGDFKARLRIGHSAVDDEALAAAVGAAVRAVVR